MGKWTQEPRAQHVLVQEQLAELFKEGGYSVAIDAEQRVTHLEIDSLSDEDVSLLVKSLKSRFPGAF